MVNANDLMVELQRLLQQECYSSAELLGGFLLSASSKTPEALGLYGDALYGKEEFRRALVRSAFSTVVLVCKPYSKYTCTSRLSTSKHRICESREAGVPRLLRVQRHLPLLVVYL